MAIEMAATRRRFTRAEYHRMAEVGILGEDDRVELIRGEIVEMSPIGRRHRAFAGNLNQLLAVRLAGRAVVWMQNPIVLVLISRLMDSVLRPFLEKWHITYWHWWENESNPRPTPLARQKDFPQLKAMLENWAAVRTIMRAVRDELVAAYKMVDVHNGRM